MLIAFPFIHHFKFNNVSISTIYLDFENFGGLNENGPHKGMVLHICMVSPQLIRRCRLVEVGLSGLEEVYT